MSEPTNEPSQASPDAPAAEAEPKPDAPVKAKDARAKLVAELAARRSKEAARAAKEDDGDDEPAVPKQKEPVTAKPDPKASALDKKIEAKEVKLEEAGIDATQKKNESDADYDLRLAKLLRENNELKAASSKSTKEAARLVKLIEDGKANPLTILDHLGVSYEDLVKGINSQKYKSPSAKPTVPQEILDQIAELKKDKTDREAAEQARTLKAQSEERMAKDTKKVQGFLDANSDDYPFLASVPWAVAEILSQAAAKKVTDVGPIMRQLEENLANNAEKLVLSDKAMKAAMKRNPELKAAFKKMFDDEPTPKGKAKADDDDEVKIRGLEDLNSDPPARSTRKSREDIKADMAAELRAKRSKRKDEEDD